MYYSSLCFRTKLNVKVRKIFLSLFPGLQLFIIGPEERVKIHYGNPRNNSRTGSNVRIQTVKCCENLTEPSLVLRPSVRLVQPTILTQRLEMVLVLSLVNKSNRLPKFSFGPDVYITFFMLLIHVSHAQFHHTVSLLYFPFSPTPRCFFLDS